MTSKVFLVNIPEAITHLKVEDWLDRLPAHAVTWAVREQERYVQIETTTRAAANLIACALESFYVPAGPFAVIRGDTEEGHALEHLFA
ncbi:hypothetical protein [Candidatus Nitrospira bockiana]